MTTYITIDGGTTNTRLNLVRDKEIISTLKLSVGARKNIENPELFKESIRDGISRLLKENNLKEDDITRILASGMITSEFGLINLPHTEAPAGIMELHDTMKEISFPEIFPFPSLSQNTILKDAVDLSDSELNEEYLIKGYEYSKTYGINNALFKTRILKNIFSCTKDETYSFFMGVVLCDEIEEIIKSDADSVVLGGKAQIKEATALILKEKCDKKIIILDEKTVDSSTALGAVRIYEN